MDRLMSTEAFSAEERSLDDEPRKSYNKDQENSIDKKEETTKYIYPEEHHQSTALDFSKFRLKT